MLTPSHIVPEWYFLPLYAILRSVPNKLFGLFLILMFFACIFLLPVICKNFTIRLGQFRPFYAISVWLFFSVCYGLGWIGGLPVISPFYEIGQVLTFLYYFLILMIFPFCGFVEKVIYVWYVTKHSVRVKLLISKSLDPFYNINKMLAIELSWLYVWLSENKAGFKFLRAHTPLAEKYAVVLLQKSEEFLRSSCVNYYNYLRMLARLRAFN
jgi:hypothetical protein